MESSCEFSIELLGSNAGKLSSGLTSSGLSSSAQLHTVSSITRNRLIVLEMLQCWIGRSFEGSSVQNTFQQFLTQ
jgi:hypothetical protein